MVSPLHRKSQGTIQPGEIIDPKPLHLALPESNARHPHRALDFIVQRNRVTPDVKAPRECFQALSGFLVYQVRGINDNPRADEVLPASDLLKLLPDPGPDLRGRQRAEQPS
jgi:hypothetical protein